MDCSSFSSYSVSDNGLAVEVGRRDIAKEILRGCIDLRGGLLGLVVIVDAL